MNKEIYYEGWLIKSPPTNRIWRARWRRRWFTLKQGEIPEQFCLEYYADRKCRKLKGVIDLDQCEQVDCGLRLENRKQKFQFMFDIKTPKRTYYLAADTETDMRDWVNCICQVCHLHDTKQSQDENRPQSTATMHTSTSNDTTSTSINSSSCGTNPNNTRQSFSNEILRRPASVVEQQPSLTGSGSVQTRANTTAPPALSSHDSSAYVNTDYSNRETLLCDAKLANALTTTQTQTQTQPPTQSQPQPQSQTQQQPQAQAQYLNTSMFQECIRHSVSSNGVVRKIPENLVLSNTPLPEAQPNSVQPSPALSTASGPYIPISECFSGSPKFLLEANNPTTPLNNLDPKFYDTPRSHNNIGLNLTSDQSYSPKITNFGTQQPLNVSKNRNHKSDSDSESVFTDDDEWTHPMPLRENMDRNTRPSDSSVENESFVLTFSQRFSKLPDEASKELKTLAASTQNPNEGLEKLAKVLKNKNNLILDFKENEKATRDLPQFSDTENTSPAFIGPKDARSVVDESYDIPRSHHLPYYNMSSLLEKVATPDADPIAASTPNLMGGTETTPGSPASIVSETHSLGPNGRTLGRHYYTNAAPTKVEGNVFRYDFEERDVPPVNRKLKPKASAEADKPPEEKPAKPPQLSTQVDALTKSLQSLAQTPTPTGDGVAPLKPPSVDRKNKPNAYKVSLIRSQAGNANAPGNKTRGATSGQPTMLTNAHKVGNSNTLGNNTRRTTSAPLSMLLSNDAELPASYVMETRTLPRQPRPNYAFSNASASQCNTPTMVNPAFGSASAVIGSAAAIAGAGGFAIQHQRTASANAGMQHVPLTAGNSSVAQLQLPHKNEHKLQYFDLDVANAPAINRQSMNASGNFGSAAASWLGMGADPSARAPVQSTVVYNSVDFVKTEAFKRIREERENQNEGVHASK